MFFVLSGLMLGGLYCFAGARLSHWLFLMNGFLLSFAFAFAVAPIFRIGTGAASALGIAGGVVLGTLFSTAAKISHFVIGAILGAVIGHLISPVTMIASAAIGGILGLLFKRPILVVGTSVTGGFLIAGSIQAWVFGESLMGTIVSPLIPGVLNAPSALRPQTIGAFVFLAFAGIVVQALAQRRESHEDHPRAIVLPETKPTIVRRPSKLTMKAAAPVKPLGSASHGEPGEETDLRPSEENAAMDTTEAPAPSESDEPLGAHQATWTEDVDLPSGPLSHERIVEAALSWERTTPIALAALVRFLDSSGRIAARALAVRGGVTHTHRLVTGDFQRDLGLGEQLIDPILLEGAQGPLLLEFTEELSRDPAEVSGVDTPRSHDLSKIDVARDSFRLSDRRPTREQIIAGFKRWERTQSRYELILVSVLNIQDEPVARALLISQALGLSIESLTEEAQREMGITSPVVGFFEVEGSDGTLLVEV